MQNLIPNFKTKPENATITEILWFLSLYTQNLAVRISLRELRELSQENLNKLMDRIYAQLAMRGIDPAKRFGD